MTFLHIFWDIFSNTHSVQWLKSSSIIHIAYSTEGIIYHIYNKLLGIYVYRRDGFMYARGTDVQPWYPHVWQNKLLSYILYWERLNSNMRRLQVKSSQVNDSQPNGTNPGLFQIRFQCIWRRGVADCRLPYWIWLAIFSCLTNNLRTIFA